MPPKTTATSTQSQVEDEDGGYPNDNVN
ncbi:uncharacterized protein G2W53_010920 [Senna tora]|uniref:Uncharacterized protein n=1 Tax=Senna tora TaxID=362788 RepID=A0A834X0T4_9FABA|nr:uncharacterized protein G2W53_010920 [Senna tora]